jgi:hypothetical protein
MRAKIKSSLVLIAAAALLAGCGGGAKSATGTGGAGQASSSSSGAVSTGTSSTGTSSTSSSTAAAPATTPKTTASSPAPGAPSGAKPESAATYGHPAGAGEQAAVTSTVKAYYAALASGSEAAACSMLGARIQGLLEKSIGRSPLLRGKGCVGAFKLLFGHRRGGASAVSRDVSVSGVRVSGDRGYALISTKALPSGEIRIEREHGAWKIGSLIGTPIASAAGQPPAAG